MHGEEFGGPPVDEGAVWVLDPIDGTYNYSTGMPLTGILLGLLVGAYGCGRPLLLIGPGVRWRRWSSSAAPREFLSRHRVGSQVSMPRVRRHSRAT